jgi:DNA polymerase III epsilon subunit-like protein
MRVLVFDTETTGLPDDYTIPAKQRRGNWPHIVSISWILLENDVPVSVKSFVVKPRGWIIPTSSTEIHKITHQYAVEKGVDLEYVITEFIKERYDLLVAHNLNFDENVLVNAIYWDLGRFNFEEFPHPKRCTMTIGRSICKLPSSNPKYFKSPKLSELYAYVFNGKPSLEHLHSSLYDTEILVKIIQTSPEVREKLGLVRKNVIPINDYFKNAKTLRL